MIKPPRTYQRNENYRGLPSADSISLSSEEYATRLAKEIKAKYGLSSLVCDPQELVSYTQSYQIAADDEF